MFTARISVAVEDFALPHALSEAPEMNVEADRLAAHSRHWVMPCLWAAGGDFEAFDAALADDPTVADVVTTRAYDEETFYQVNWTDDIKRHVDVCLDKQGSLMHAETTNGEWHLTFRFASREQFETFREYCARQDMGFRLENLTEASAPQQFMGGLSGPQREALVTAVEAGYFAIPRQATMEDVAAELDISTQAASERIRRGVEQFVTTMLVASEDVIEA